MSLGWTLLVVGGLVVYGLIFGKSKEYEYEAKLIPEGNNEIVGEVEIKKYKSENPVGELALYSPQFNFKGMVEIFNNETLISRFEISEGKSPRLLFPTPSPLVTKMKNTGLQKVGNAYRFPVKEDLFVQNNHKVRICMSDRPQLYGVFLKD